MIYDISQGVFGCANYPTHPSASKHKVKDMDKTDVYNLTCFSMCAHNGTHVDAPCHFIKDGKTIDQMPLEAFIGPACVVPFQGEISANDALSLLQRNHNTKRLLIKGDAIVTLEAAEIFAQADLLLLGSESCCIGPIKAPLAVHKALLQKDVVLLEGIRLNEVNEGMYFLSAAPLNLEGSDGAPCRAYLMDRSSYE